jgi:hypothetical protein
VKCHQNTANPTLHAPNRLEMRTKLLWTFLAMDLILLPMEEMEKWMELMKEALPMRHSTFLLREHQQQHHYHQHQPENHSGPENLRFACGVAD